ncbi:MAG: uroporphyrinogen-III synthase [Pseudohongiellaceae bacterium]
MMPPTLPANLVVLNTRPARQQAQLTAAIEQAGGRVVSLPMIEIEALEDAEAVARIRSQINELERFDMLIFVSANAAEIGVGWIEQFWPGLLNELPQRLPKELTIIGVGPATGAVLQERLGVPVVSAADSTGSEAVLQLPALFQVSGQRVAIIRGCGGRELLADTLRERGAEVEYIEVYRRTPCRYPPAEVANRIKQEGVNAIVITSAESLISFKAALTGDADVVDVGNASGGTITNSPANIGAASLIPLVVPSARIADQAGKAGFRRVISADGSDPQSLLAALATLSASA